MGNKRHLSSQYLQSLAFGSLRQSEPYEFSQYLQSLAAAGTGVFMA